MLRFLLLLTVLATAASGAETAPAVPDAGQVDHWVALFNQDLVGMTSSNKTLNPMSGAFDAPATDIAREVASSTWYTLLVFLPFLVLPQVLLVYILFKFRKKNDGRKAATFMGNHKLEIIWTAIPIIALVIVVIPTWKLLMKMTEPPPDQRPDQDMVVAVTGKQFAWDYKYQRLGGGVPTRSSLQFELGQDVAGTQEPLLLVKGRRVIMSFTSNDVNHAWSIPAFGIKQDTIKGRYTNAWFTPERTGFFKGQCGELCGQGHGIMLISALVVEAPEFEVWVSAQHHRADTLGIWSAISAETLDGPALEAAVAAYFAKDGSEARVFGLRFWVASGFTSLSRKPGKMTQGQVLTLAKDRRALLETLINRYAGPRLAGL